MIFLSWRRKIYQNLISFCNRLNEGFVIAVPYTKKYNSSMSNMKQPRIRFANSLFAFSLLIMSYFVQLASRKKKGYQIDFVYCVCVLWWGTRIIKWLRRKVMLPRFLIEVVVVGCFSYSYEKKIIIGPHKCNKLITGIRAINSYSTKR